jgi:hypothetical protein
MDRVFSHTINLGPALAANHTFNFVVPFGCQLVHVSACNSTADAGTLDIGTTSDDDAYLDTVAFGVSGTPLEYDLADFVGTQYPKFADGDVISVLITDHDDAHMANVCVVLTFTEG